MTARNACLLLSQSRLFEEPELMQRCWEVIDAQVRDDESDEVLVVVEVLEDEENVEQTFALPQHTTHGFADMAETVV